MNRSSGVLLHLTSLPGGEGIGDLGASAAVFVDWLVAAGQSWWQVLPCGEIGQGESPYQSCSAYAGNPLLISLAALVENGLLKQHELGVVTSETDTVDYPDVRQRKERALAILCEHFYGRASTQLLSAFSQFEMSPQQHWLHDYARFVVLKRRFGDLAWTSWPAEYARRDAATLKAFDAQEAIALQAVKIVQFIFFSQWQVLRNYANARGISLLGDCPIYVAADSVDVWRYPHLFDLHADGTPRVVAGVPPDYFSATGQLWGNPLYLWDRAKADDFSWWRDRIRHCARQFDLTRIDHFRGLEAFWEVPASAPDASSGCWRQGPGREFLSALQRDFPHLPLVAEDLGDLTARVHELRERFQLPGMRVLQFGFDGGDDNPHAPERITSDVICYAGTHDNNTTLGWIRELAANQYEALCKRFGCSTDVQLVDAIVWQVLTSAAQIAIVSMQDLLHLPESARFNTPGTVGDNWRWRVLSSELSEELAGRLSDWSASVGRYDETRVLEPICALNPTVTEDTPGGQPQALEG